MLNTKNLLQHKQQDLKWKRLLESCDFTGLADWAIDKLVESCGKRPYTLHGSLFFECLQQEQKERKAEKQAFHALQQARKSFKAAVAVEQQAKKNCSDCLHLSKQSNEQPCCNCLALADCTSELVLFYHEKALP